MEEDILLQISNLSDRRDGYVAKAKLFLDRFKMCFIVKDGDSGKTNVIDLRTDTDGIRAIIEEIAIIESEIMALVKKLHGA